MRPGKTTQFSILVKDVSREMFRILDPLKKAGVEIVAAAAEMADGKGTLRFVTGDARKTLKVLEGLKVAYHETDVYLLETSPVKVELQKVFDQLTQRRVGIVNLYGSITEESGWMVLQVSDLPATLEVLEAAAPVAA